MLPQIPEIDIRVSHIFLSVLCNEHSHCKIHGLHAKPAWKVGEKKSQISKFKLGTQIKYLVFKSIQHFQAESKQRKSSRLLLVV